MLRTRIVTALIGFLVAVFSIREGGYLFNGILGVLALIGWHEYLTMMRKKRIPIDVLWGYVTFLMTMICFALQLYTTAVFVGILMALRIATSYIFSPLRTASMRMAYSLFGVFYVGTAFAVMIVMRDSAFYAGTDAALLPDSGQSVIWLLFFSVWASDTFAYFAGRLWGKRKIVPLISPNKTLEGYVGGFIGSVITALCCIFFTGLPLSWGIGAGLLVGIFAPLGDLFESKLKRTAGVKDSGMLLPGHGGVLDRFDSLLFAAPAVFAVLMLLK